MLWCVSRQCMLTGQTISIFFFHFWSLLLYYVLQYAWLYDWGSLSNNAGIFLPTLGCDRCHILFLTKFYLPSMFIHLVKPTLFYYCTSKFQYLMFRDNITDNKRTKLPFDFNRFMKFSMLLCLLSKLAAARRKAKLLNSRFNTLCEIASWGIHWFNNGDTPLLS